VDSGEAFTRSVGCYRISEYRNFLGEKQVPDGEGDSVDQPIYEPGAGQASQEDEPEPNSDVDLNRKVKCSKSFSIM
jgi:hypothetical protein